MQILATYLRWKHFTTVHKPDIGHSFTVAFELTERSLWLSHIHVMNWVIWITTRGTNAILLHHSHTSWTKSKVKFLAGMELDRTDIGLSVQCINALDSVGRPQFHYTHTFYIWMPAVAILSNLYNHRLMCSWWEHFFLAVLKSHTQTQPS